MFITTPLKIKMNRLIYILTSTDLYYRVVLDSAVVYNLKGRTFRSIAKLPDAVQAPAVCVHNDEVYVTGHRNIYKYEEIGQTDRWTKVLEMDITPGYLVSFKGYIYVAQCYFPSLLRFKPGVDDSLQQIASFCHPPRAICNLGELTNTLVLLFFFPCKKY